MYLSARRTVIVRSLYQRKEERTQCNSVRNSLVCIGKINSNCRNCRNRERVITDLISKCIASNALVIKSITSCSFLLAREYFCRVMAILCQRCDILVYFIATGYVYIMANNISFKYFNDFIFSMNIFHVNDH